jgi:protein-S-isoprenylcysteine O-methyltransferase Ste14
VQNRHGENLMGGFAALSYGLICYAIFFVTFLYAIGFVGNFIVPKGIDSGAMGSLAVSLAVDTLLLGIFAIQHSVMARPAFKRWWTRFVPRSVERSTYVLFASLALIVLFACWQPVTIPVWTVDNMLGASVLHGVFWLGWALVLLSTFLIDHFELFGLKQVVARMLGRELPAPVFHTPLLYRWTRHPLYLGFLLAFWATPTMTLGHLLFAIGTTGYILIAIVFEERDLIDLFGDQYRRYRQQVSMLIPWPRGGNVDSVTPRHSSTP